MKNDTFAILCAMVVGAGYALATPPRAAPPSPNRTAPAVKATTEPEPNPRPRDNIQGADAAGEDVATTVFPRLRTLGECRAEAKETGKRLLVVLHDPSDGSANLWVWGVLVHPTVVAAIKQGWVLHRSTPVEWRTTGPLLLILDPPEKGNGKCKPIVPPADAAALAKLLTY